MKEEIRNIIITAILFIIVLINPFNNELISKGLYIIAYLIIGGEVVISAIKNIFKGEVFDEEFLMTVATIGAFAIGEFPEAVAVMLFYQIGEMFQDYAVDKSKKSITELMDIRPDVAYVKRNGKVEKVSPEIVKIEEEIVVKPGERIPLDGEVIEGISMLDTSALTGESVPRSIKVGDKVLSGFINQSGVISIRVEKEFGDSTVSKILDLVENASNKKSKSENFIRKFAKYYTPIVVVGALLLAIIPPFLLHLGSFGEWLYRALTFLVVSCPCALVVSVPLGFFAGIGAASKIGVLVKGSNYLEALANTEIVVFDKTGTLTYGKLKVAEIINYSELPKTELMQITGSLESKSTHPIGQAFKDYLKENKIEKINVNEFENITGLGITGNINNEKIILGNYKILEHFNIKNTHKEDEEKLAKQGNSIIYVVKENNIIALIGVNDIIRDNVKDVIEKFNKNHIETIMLTGDNKQTAQRIAKEIGIKQVIADVIPTEKTKTIKDLKKQGKKVIMCGDGINDSPALASSDIGISVNSGTDIAMDSSDVILMKNDLSKIMDLITISKKTIRNIKQNLFWAFFYNILMIPIAIGLLKPIGISINPMIAGLAMTLSSLTVILNSLRLKNIKL